jgi:hypothetical protein
MRRALVALLLVVAAIAGTPARTAAADGFEFTTRVTYAVLADDRRIDARIDGTFKNTTPNPAGQFSVFDEVTLALQDGATELTAADGEGELTSSLAVADGVNVATIELREGVRYNQSVALTITYRLADGGAGGIRVRPSAVVFPAWAFGTAGDVAVTVPSDFEVSTDGDTLQAESTADGIVLTSGAVADPARWLSQVVATSETEFVTTTRSVPLDGGTVDLQVRAFDDDPEWGEATADLLADALPLIQDQLGLEYTRQGSVVVTETVDLAVEAGIGEGTNATPELVIGFDQAPFAIIHQATHLWITEQLASERWILEGIASWAAGRVAAELDIVAPYVPAERVGELAETAFPLESWGVGDATGQQDAFGYAASWDLTNELVEAVTQADFASALRRITADRSAYDPVADEEPDPGAVPINPVDSRRLLDHLEAVSGADLAPTFAERVFGEGIAADLEARAAARDALEALRVQAGDWGAPGTVTVPMAAWQFEEAEAAMEAASTWLDDRDALMEAIGEAGLTTPSRLRDRYVEFGGGSEARSELEAERAVVTAYGAALDDSVAERGIVERIGLLGGPDPAVILQRANGTFAEGDLDTALSESHQAQALLDGAQTAGIVRLLSAALVLLVGLAAAVWLVRRRQTAPA